MLAYRYNDETLYWTQESNGPGESAQHMRIQAKSNNTTTVSLSNVYTQSIHLTIKTHTKDKKRKFLHSDVKNQYKWLFTALEGIQVIQ